MKSYQITIVIASLIIGFCLISIDRKDAFSQSLEWVPESNMLTARDSFTGGVIGGKIYVFGGNGDSDGFNLKSTEMFDPSTHLWTYKSSNENNGGQGVEELSGAVLNDKLYVFGAWGGGTPYGVFNFVQEYNHATDTWTSKASKPTTVSSAPAVLYNGEIFLFGGEYANDTGTDIAYDVVEAYNPTSNTWRTVTNMPYTLGMMSIGVVGTKAYLIGGLDLNTYSILQNVIAYDFESNQWITNGLGTLPTPRLFSYSSAPIVDGKIYQIGGMVSNVGWTITGQSDVSITNEVLVYDPSTQSFSSGPPLPQATNSLLALSNNNFIFTIGGETDWENDSRTSAVWRLDLAPKPNIVPIISLLLADAKEKCSELSETWHIELSDGSGSGEYVLKKDSNCVVTSSGIITFATPYGYDVTMSFQNGSLSGSDGEYDSIATGIASTPYGNSNFKMTTSGVVAKGYGTGQTETEFFSPGWPAKTTGTFIMTRIEGSGITPETGSVDINEGSDNQYLYCMSDCSRMGWVITNASNVPTTITNTQSCQNEYNEFGIKTVTTCTGEILVESTGITYNSSTIYNYETCTIEIVVDGLGSCQTN